MQTKFFLLLLPLLFGAVQAVTVPVGYYGYVQPHFTEDPYFKESVRPFTSTAKRETVVAFLAKMQSLYNEKLQHDTSAGEALYAMLAELGDPAKMQKIKGFVDGSRLIPFDDFKDAVMTLRLPDTLPVHIPDIRPEFTIGK